MTTVLILLLIGFLLWIIADRVVIRRYQKKLARARECLAEPRDCAKCALVYMPPVQEICTSGETEDEEWPELIG